MEDVKVNMTRDDFMEAVRSDFINKLSIDDRMEVFATMPVGADDVTEEVLNEILRDFDSPNEVVIKTPKVGVLKLDVAQVAYAAEGWKLVTPSSCKAIVRVMENSGTFSETELEKEIQMLHVPCRDIAQVAVRFDVNLYPVEMMDGVVDGTPASITSDRVFFILDELFQNDVVSEWGVSIQMQHCKKLLDKKPSMSVSGVVASLFTLNIEAYV